MKIAVLIKQVPAGRVDVDPQTHALVRQSGETMLNPSDLNAIEAALLLKERTGAEVFAFTMGPPDAEKALRTALAMGCDTGFLVTDPAFGGADTVATARVLAAAVAHGGSFDLVLAGSQSADGATGQVGPMVAEFMGLPHVAEISECIYDTAAPQEIRVLRRHGAKKSLISATLPALLTVSFGANTPRLTTLRSQRASKAKQVSTLTNAELGLHQQTVGLAGSPTLVVDSWQPPQKRRAVFLTGSVHEVAHQIMALVDGAKETD